MALPRINSKDCDYIVALVGAPNSGKTTLFNVLTGSSEFVANWPGVTVDVRVAIMRIDGKKLCIVDLPGTYSISGDTAEERVTRSFLTENLVDVIVVLADSTILERSLYLPLEVMSVYDNVVLVLTKADEAERKGISIDVQGLSRELGIPVVMISALEGKGIEELLKAIKECISKQQPTQGIKIDYGKLSPYVEELAERIRRLGVDERRAKWFAAALIQGHEWVIEELKKLKHNNRNDDGKDIEELERLAERIRDRLRQEGIEPIVEIPRIYYDLAAALYEKYVRKREEEVTLSRFDRLLLHPFLGPVISGLASFAIILLAYIVATGSPLDSLLDALGLHKAARLVSEYSLVNLVAAGMDWLASIAESTIPNPVIARMIGEGVLSSSYGVGLVISFLPLVAVMMLILGVLEDSGVLTRLAAGFDNVFRKFGVSGKALFPVLVSFGCNVPGVLSTRIMENEEERRAVIFALPFIPCSARLTVILAFAHVFFGSGIEKALVVLVVYAIAITAFLLTLRLFGYFEGLEPSELVLELTPIKKPSMRVVWWFFWDKIKHFLVRAGTVITIASIFLWILASYGPSGYLKYNETSYNPGASYAASIGRAIAPYVELVFGVNESLAWRIGCGLLGGFLAKEVFLDSLAAVSPIHGSGEEFATLKAYSLDPWAALALLVAVTLYVPCISTLSVIYAETRSVKLTTAVFLYDLSVASLVALIIRLIGGLLAIL